MNFEQAIQELSFHCGTNPDTDDPRWQNGFLGMLRPYSGLKVEAYQNLSRCVDAVENHLRSSSVLDRRVINSLWGICHFARAWGLHPDGMLRRNNLITPEDQARLCEWIDGLSYKIAMWLDGTDQ